MRRSISKLSSTIAGRGNCSTTEGRTLRLTTPETPLLIHGDELRIEQVLHNLIGNAIKYSQAPAPIIVTVTAMTNDVAVVVHDQGIGIPQDALLHLFQRCYRAQNAAAHQISGLGIGLHVVKETIELHGGTVSVESTEGSGSIFTVRLPLPDSVIVSEADAGVGESQRLIMRGDT